MWLFGVTFFLDMACQADLRQFIFFLLAAHSILGVAFRFFWAYPRRQDLKFSKLLATQSGIQTALVPQMPGTAYRLYLSIGVAGCLSPKNEFPCHCFGVKAPKSQPRQKGCRRPSLRKGEYHDNCPGKKRKPLYVLRLANQKNSSTYSLGFLQLLFLTPL